ncbi:MAG: hypothetical protein ACTHM2_05100 [Afipia sp.]
MAKSKSETKLEAATAQHEAAKRLLQNLQEREGAASETAESYAEWREQVAKASAEVARLEALIARVERDREAEQKRAADAAQARLELEAEREAEKVSKRIVEFLTEVGPRARELIREIAISDELIERANRARGEDKDRIPTAECRVRYCAGSPERIVSEKIVERWCYAETGYVLSAEDAARVSPSSDDSLVGMLPPLDNAVTLRGNKVVKRKFRKTVKIPATERQRFVSLAESLAVPGIVAGDPPYWAPIRYGSPQAAISQLEAFERHKAAREPVASLEAVDETIEVVDVATAA